MWRRWHGNSFSIEQNSAFFNWTVKKCCVEDKHESLTSPGQLQDRPKHLKLIVGEFWQQHQCVGRLHSPGTVRWAQHSGPTRAQGLSPFLWNLQTVYEVWPTAQGCRIYAVRGAAASIEGVTDRRTNFIRYARVPHADVADGRKQCTITDIHGKKQQKVLLCRNVMDKVVRIRKLTVLSNIDVSIAPVSGASLSFRGRMTLTQHQAHDKWLMLSSVCLMPSSSKAYVHARGARPEVSRKTKRTHPLWSSTKATEFVLGNEEACEWGFLYLVSFFSIHNSHYTLLTAREIESGNHRWRRVRATWAHTKK